MFRALILLTFLSTAQIVYGTQIDLKNVVAQEVERVKQLSGRSLSNFDDLPGLGPQDESSPVQKLIKYGMDAVPHLIPYLADSSFTQAYRDHRARTPSVRAHVRVNEYIIFVLNRITEHRFYLPPEQSAAARMAGAVVDPALPKDIEELQAQINTWWRNNGTKTLLDRKIDDVNDSIHDNRFSAYEWLGRTKSEAGRLPLERRIDSLLTGEVNSLKHSEMAACAESLAKIGNYQSADVVRRVCDHLSYWVYRSYRPVGEGRSGLGSMQISDLFKAYHAWSSLGFKEEALSRLHELEAKYFGEMDLSTQQEFLRNLVDAWNWQTAP